MFEELIGARLTRIDNGGFEVVLQNGENRTFEFEEDYGGCCGYNEITTNLLLPERESLDNAPVITEVLINDPMANSMVSRYCIHNSDCITVTFMGEYKPIAEINSESGSGSGWQYGAHAWVVCKETGKTEELTSW